MRRGFHAKRKKIRVRKMYKQVRVKASPLQRAGMNKKKDRTFVTERENHIGREGGPRKCLGRGPERKSKQKGIISKSVEATMPRPKNPSGDKILD